MRQFILLLLLTSILAACKTSKEATQEKIPLSAEISSGLIPSLLVKLPGDSISQSIPLTSLGIKVDASCPLVRTTVDLSFYNTHNRMLEGSLYFPLLPGQRVTGFSMEVDGKLRKAVPVSKQTGRVAYENITRQKIDPALVEWTQGNNFKTRIYPLMPKTQKKVQIIIEQELSKTGEGWTYRFPLGDLDSLNYQVEGNFWGVENLPTLSPDFEQSYDTATNAFQFKKEVAFTKPDQILGISWQDTSEEAKVFIEEGIDGESWFLINAPKPISKNPGLNPKRLAYVGTYLPPPKIGT